ncbi:MGA_1079 family surface serine endopeptidase [[Mycoplasma] anseris]|uniref:Uncharacterized protein n=1 Tax=[Mycoplasma] anseris TaxID=92400 RepID=A0A2Z4NDD8_9BACT|nr:hypothetical protein [[Mycoplasma] anseris]AWX69569.1 hypothetical protein DP065_02280 [[Mycoplasma] anseris]
MNKKSKILLTSLVSLGLIGLPLISVSCKKEQKEQPTKKDYYKEEIHPLLIEFDSFKLELKALKIDQYIDKVDQFLAQHNFIDLENKSIDELKLIKPKLIEASNQAKALIKEIKDYLKAKDDKIINTKKTNIESITLLVAKLKAQIDEAKKIDWNLSEIENYVTNLNYGLDNSIEELSDIINILNGHSKYINQNYNSLKVKFITEYQTKITNKINEINHLKNKYINVKLETNGFSFLKEQNYETIEEIIKLKPTLEYLNTKYIDLENKYNQFLNENEEYKNELGRLLEFHIEKKYQSFVPNLNVLSINDSNIDLYIKNNLESLNVNNLKFKELSIDETNSNQLNLKYTAINPQNNSEVEVIKNIVIENDINPYLDQIQYNNLDDLFKLDYKNLNRIFFSELVNFQDSLIKPKKEIVNNYFSFKIKANSFKVIDNHLEAKVQFINKNKVLKELKLQTANKIDFLDAKYENIKIKLKEDFLNSQYYLNGLEDSNRINYFFNTKFATEAEKLNKNSFNINLVTNPFENDKTLTYEEKKSIITKTLSSIIDNIKINDFNVVNWKLVNLSETDIYTIDNFSNIATFKMILFDADNQEHEYLFNLKSQDYLQIEEDNQNLETIKAMLTSRNGSEIFKHIKLKTDLTNSDLIAKEGLSRFEELFELSKLGRYQIAIKNKDQAIVDNLKGSITLKFTYTKNGKLANQYNPSNSSAVIVINYFKPMNYFDIKPKNNEWFSDADFISLEYKKPNQTIQNQINEINATDFEYNLANGKKIISVEEILEQKAYSSLNYLFNFTGSTEVPKEDGNFDNSGFENPEVPPAINHENLYSYFDKETKVNVNDLARDFFIYYYDVNGSSRNNVGALSFKLGFINKKDNNIRFHTSQKITLINLKNDFKNEYYPEIIANNITFNDLFIDYNGDGFITKGIKNYLPSDLINMFADPNQKQLLDQLIRVKGVQKYNHFAIAPTDFKIAEFKLPNNHDGEIYFRLKYEKNNVIKQAKQWFKLTGLKADPNSPTQSIANQNELANLLDGNTNSLNHHMTKIFLEKNQIFRNRNIELSQNDNNWILNNEKTKASWLLKNDYLKHFVNNNDLKLHLHLYAGPIILDDLRSKRIRELNTGIQFNLDYHRLKEGFVIQNETSTFNTKNGSIHIEYSIKATLKAEGILFELQLTNPNYKLQMGDYINSTKSSLFDIFDSSNSLWNTFNPEKAFYIDKYASFLNVSYSNSIGNEVFSENKSNEFNYKLMSYTQENTPLVLYSKDNEIDPFAYNPNQNLFYKFHDGYKLNTTYLHQNYEQSAFFKNLTARSVAFNRGSALMIGKANKDPNSGIFYLLTNNHVLGVDNNTAHNNEFNGSFLITRYGNNFGNNKKNGFGYWGGLYASYVSVLPIWTGRNQISKDDSLKNQFVDLTIFAVDVNKIIAQAKAEAKYETAKFYENWFNLPNLKFNDIGNYYSMFMPKNQATNLGFVGFPYGKQAGYIINRVVVDDTRYIFNKQFDYMPTYYNAGNSGTGVIDNQGNYVTTINSGSPLKSLTSYKFNNTAYDYFGLDKINFFNQANTNSLSSNILKFNAKKPNEFALPFYWEEHNEN